jgi:hypothetical protein
MGAVQVNARYDWLDLSDAGIVGGRQQIAGASALWIPTDYVRFIVNYGHLWLQGRRDHRPAADRDLFRPTLWACARSSISEGGSRGRHCVSYTARRGLWRRACLSPPSRRAAACHRKARLR